MEAHDAVKEAVGAALKVPQSALELVNLKKPGSHGMKKQKWAKLSAAISEGIVHEAGHCTVALALSEKVERIEFRIMRGDGKIFFVGTLDKDQEAFKKAMAIPEERDRAILHRLAVGHGGLFASLNIFGKHGFSGSENDFKEMVDLLHNLVPEHQREGVINAAAALAGQIIRDNLEAVKTIAERLSEKIKRGENPARIEGPEIEGLVGPLLLPPLRELVGDALECV